MTTKSQQSAQPAISIVHTGRRLPSGWLALLIDDIEEQYGVRPHAEPLEAVNPSNDCIYILTAEMKWFLLNDIDRNTFDQVQRILNTSLGVLWLGCGGLIAGSNPYYALTLGILRTIRLEKTDRRFVHLDFESCVDPWTLNNAAHITDVFLHSFDYSRAHADIEVEYAVKKGTLHVSRFCSKPHSLSRDVSALDGTYLITGGLGRIGRSITPWMAKKAQHILITSRNATSHPDAAELVNKTKQTGCHLHIRDCDISNETSLQNLIADCAASMPPIRGVIHLASIRDDTALIHMTHEQWQRVTLPKVSSMNLHNNLPGLDFFVMVSSTAGLTGRASQANYAAGDAFQDALARHRSSRKLPAVVLDLGDVPVDRVLGLVEEAVRDPGPRSLDYCQVIVDDGLVSVPGRQFDTLKQVQQPILGHMEWQEFAW